MNTNRWLILGIVVVVIAVVAFLLFGGGASIPSSSAVATSTVPANTYGMSKYTDPSYGFTFWYPSSLQVTTSTTTSSTNFPGGIQVERLQVGDLGGTYIAVVNSSQSMITDEPDGHAAPIPQTKYFYDSATKAWMVAYPEGAETGTGGATTTANTSQMTISGLPMLPSGARFDTTIIPLSTTQFLVIGDGGGSGFTTKMAQTVALADASINPTALANALQAEASSYTNP